MSKPRVPTLASRVGMADASRVKPLNPDAWREGLTTAQRGYGGKWQRYRIRFLEKNPLCVRCREEGRVTAATVVDHVIPHRGDMKLFWSGAHQALCASCHGKKSIEEGGIGTFRKG